jgi:hypothetical protein
LLGKSSDEAFVLLKVLPKYRLEAYEKVKKLRPLRLHRVTGSADMLLMVGGADLADFLAKVADITGVVETSTHTVLTTWRPETA